NVGEEMKRKTRVMAHLRSQFIKWRLFAARNDASIVVFTTHHDLADLVHIKHCNRPAMERFLRCLHLAPNKIAARERAVSCYLNDNTTHRDMDVPGRHDEVGYCFPPDRVMHAYKVTSFATNAERRIYILAVRRVQACKGFRIPGVPSRNPIPADLFRAHSVPP